MDSFKHIFCIKAVPSLSFINHSTIFLNFLHGNEYLNEIEYMAAKNSICSIFSDVNKVTKDHSYAAKYFEAFPMC
jgi:hypothetical protein